MAGEVENIEYRSYVCREDQSLLEFIKDIRNLTDQEISQMKYVEANGDLEDAILNLRTNKDKIYAKYNTERKDYSEGSKELVKIGTSLDFPVDFLVEADEIISTKVQAIIALKKSKNFETFVGESIKELTADEDLYAPRLNMLRNNNTGQNVDKRDLQINVFVLNRATLNSSDPVLTNISAFVMNCNTNVTVTGGNFSMSMPPITARYDEEGNLLPLEQLVTKYDFADGKSNYVFDDNTYFKGKFAGGKDNRSKDERLIRKPTYFSRALQAQDLVFIKMEALAAEEDVLLDPLKDLSLRDIQGGIFDMIGLIDNVEENYQGAQADVTVNISGRDLVKLIINDGVYFFPATLQSKEFKSQYFANREEALKSKAFDRLLGQIQDVSLYTNQPLSYTLNYIFQKFSQIQVFPSELFEPLAAADVDTEDYDLFLEMQNKIPSTAEKTKTVAEADPRLGIWKLVKLIIDPEVKDKIMVDSSIATSSGSLLNFIQRICQMPFVEFFTDTYGDRFYWIARRPPWIKKSFLENKSIDIFEDDVLSTSLMMNDQEVYSWFRLVPLKAYYGDANFARFYFPAIFFPEFAEIYGSRPLEITSNYVEYGTGLGAEVNQAFSQAVEELRFIVESYAHLPFTRKGQIVINGDRRIKRGMNVYLKSTDELFYVEGVSNRYQVNEGGTDRVTVLQVSRGIVLRHADKYFQLIDYGDQVPQSSFDNLMGEDLIRAKERAQDAEEQARRSKERLANWKVDKDNFEFLTAMKQFGTDIPVDEAPFPAATPRPDYDA